jgi:hypothetical protein
LILTFADIISMYTDQHLRWLKLTLYCLSFDYGFLITPLVSSSLCCFLTISPKSCIINTITAFWIGQYELFIYVVNHYRPWLKAEVNIDSQGPLKTHYWLLLITVVVYNQICKQKYNQSTLCRHNYNYMFSSWYSWYENCIY